MYHSFMEKSKHPRQGPLEYIKLVGSNDVVTYRLFQREYKWWTSLLSKQLCQGRGEIRKGSSTNDEELEQALFGMIHFLSPQTLEDCDNASNDGIIYLDRPLNAKGRYADEY
jgi:hypothetical protein